MNKSTSFLFCLLVLWVGPCQSNPGVIDFFFGKDCDDAEYKWETNDCAIVFDEEDCQDGKITLE